MRADPRASFYAKLGIFQSPSSSPSHRSRKRPSLLASPHSSIPTEQPSVVTPPSPQNTNNNDPLVDTSASDALNSLPKLSREHLDIMAQTQSVEGDRAELVNSYERHESASSLLMNNEDIWVKGILPFLGPGHFIFVAGANRKSKDYYNKYFATLPNPPKIRLKGGSTRLSLASDTFDTAAFSSMSCARFWDRNTKKDRYNQRRFQHICTIVSQSGNLPLLQWMRQIGLQWKKRGFTGMAARNGDLALLKWAHENGCPWDETVCSSAARGGHVDVLRWAHENGHEIQAIVCQVAAYWGHMEVLKFAHENNCPWDETVCSSAAMKGHLGVLKWARENGCPWNEDTCAAAAGGGHMEVLMWAHAEGCPWNEHTCAGAAGGGYLDILQWVHENGCPWDEDTCSQAASRGQLEILKWARKTGCPWNEATCANAAAKGRLKVLKWAHLNGCPWDERTCAEAVRRGNDKILKYAVKHGCPRC